MMDIAPDFANVRNANGDLEQVDPDSVAVGSEIVVKPGERVPLSMASLWKALLSLIRQH